MAVETITNAEDLLLQAALDINPDGDFRPGTAIFDLAIKPIAEILQPVLDDIGDIALRQSLARLEDLSDEDVDELLANIFVTRRGGAKARGTVRILFDDPISFLVPSGTTFLSAANQTFFTESDQSITSAAMSLNIQGDLFFFEVTVIAEEEGEEFNLEANQIVDVLLTEESIVQVDNPLPFTAGIDRETNAEFFARGVQSITTRDLVTPPGIKTTLLDAFAFIRNLQSVGFSDPEMIRDILVGTGLSIGGLDLGDTTGVNIGGKVDVYFQVDARSQKTLDLDPAQARNRLRSKDDLDGPTASDEQFLVPGGVVSVVVSTNGDTILTSPDLDLVINEIAGRTVEFLTGQERRNRFTVLSNTNDTVTLSGEAKADVGDAFFVKDVVTLPIIRVLQVEEIDPATKDPIGVLLVEDTDFIFTVDVPSLRLADTERVSFILTELGATLTAVATTLGLNTVLTDSSLSLTPNSLNGRLVRMVDGAGFGEEFTVITNTQTTITIVGDQTAKVAIGDRLVLIGGPNVGRSFRITYETQEEVSTVQDFVEAPANRVVTADILAKAANAVFVDVTLQVALKTGTLDLVAIQTAIEEFIREELGFSADLEVSDLVDLAYETQAATREDFKVRLPVTLNFETRNIQGQIIKDSSQDALETDRTEVFVPRTIVVSEI